MRQLANQVKQIPVGLGSTAREVLALLAEHADEDGFGHVPLRNLRYRSDLSNTRFNEQLEVLKEDGWVKMDSTFGGYQINLDMVIAA